MTETKLASPSSKENTELVTRRDRAYRLQFRHKNRFQTPGGAVKEKVFWFDGNLKEAVARARVHCDLMDYVFVYCMPHIVDLEAQEKLKLGDEFNEHSDEY